MVGPKMLSERDKEKLQMDIVDEQVDTIGKTFFGKAIDKSLSSVKKYMKEEGENLKKILES